MNRALTEGPQRIERRGDRVVVIPEAEYDRLTGNQQSLVEFPLNGLELSDPDTTRDESPMRYVGL